MKKPLDQPTINSLFESVQYSDANAALTIGLLKDEFDLSQIRQSVALTPDAKADSHFVNQLDLYLFSVFLNRNQTAAALFDSDHQSVSAEAASNKTILQHSQALGGRPIAVSGADDICWAVLSDDENALKDLLKVYDEKGISPAVNQRTAVPFSVTSLGNADAKKHTPLDLAVMMFVAQASSGASTQMIERNIELLLERGARGSDNAYFSYSHANNVDPFVACDAFEEMSLKEFCRLNKELFPAYLLNDLTKSAPAPDRRPEL